MTKSASGPQAGKTSQPKLIIFAPNVGSGGGLVLLLELLKGPWGTTSVVAFLDDRAAAAFATPQQGVQVRWCRSSLAGRYGAESELSRLAAPDDVVLCFHNLPPLLPCRGRVFCYLQNAALVGLIKPRQMSRRVRVRTAVERIIAFCRRSAVSTYVVQSTTMKEALEARSGLTPSSIITFPFGDFGDVNRTAKSETYWDFVYPADGSLHKNHRRLFDAWELLAQDGLFPSLAVTLCPDRSRELILDLKRARERLGLRIENLGWLERERTLEVYAQAGALVFPSFAESFGLPLMEAERAGLAILASERDYVRDVCDPQETFDPSSARSIARAVKRKLGAPADIQISNPPASFAAFLQARVQRTE